MIPAAITMTVLTHPLQVALVAVILFQGVRAAIAAVAGARRPGTGSQPGRSHLRTA